MSTKKYVEGLIKNLNGEAEDRAKKLKRAEIAHQMGGILVGTVGFFTLFGMPLMGLPLLGLAGGLFLNRKKIMANEQAVIDRITGESNHLSNVLKNGLQVGDKVQQQRKAEIKRLNQERLAEEKEIERVDAASNFGNLVIAGGAAATWVFASTGLGIIPLVGLGIKYFADKKGMKIHKKNSETCMKLNNQIYDHNLNIRLSKKRPTNTQQQTNTNGTSKGKTKSTQKTQQAQPNPKSRVINDMGNYSSEDIAAVEEYMRKMERGSASKGGYQKRKI